MARNGAARYWYLAVAVVVAVALTGQFVQVLSHHRSVLNFFSYFTVQSNILVGAMAVTIVIDPTSDGRGARILRLAALTGITVTGLVYAIAIAPHTNPQGADRVFDVLLHYVVPAMTVLGFLFLRPRVVLRRGDLAFMAWPVAWLAYTLVRAAVSDPAYPRADGTSAQYPYGFLDVDLHGWGRVVLAILLVAALLVALASVYIWASRRLAQTARGRS